MPQTDSFDEWLRTARPRLLRLALGRVRDRALAEDLVQETALAVWRRHSAGGVENLDAYANRAVWRNAIRAHQRRRRFESLETAEWEGAAWVAPAAEAWMASSEVERALARLPTTQAAAIRLRFYAGLSFAEMAEALSIGLNTAASRTRYALAALKKILEGVASAPNTASPRPGAPQELNHGQRKAGNAGKARRRARRRNDGAGGDRHGHTLRG